MRRRNSDNRLDKQLIAVFVRMIFATMNVVYQMLSYVVNLFDGLVTQTIFFNIERICHSLSPLSFHLNRIALLLEFLSDFCLPRFESRLTAPSLRRTGHRLES